MASSFVNGDAGTGVLKSPLFRIERRYVNFLIGGGVDYQREYVALWIDGKEVKKKYGGIIDVSWNMSLGMLLNIWEKMPGLF